jgi:hypothetical protein
MGRNLTPSGSRVLRAKKSVTEVGPPRTIDSASSTLNAPTVASSSSFASGTACSAARFIAVTSSSTRFFCPSLDSSLAASSSMPGSGMRTLGLPRSRRCGRAGRPPMRHPAAAPRAHRPRRRPCPGPTRAASGRPHAAAASVARVNCRRCMLLLPRMSKTPSLARRRLLLAGLRPGRGRAARLQQPRPGARFHLHAARRQQGQYAGAARQGAAGQLLGHQLRHLRQGNAADRRHPPQVPAARLRDAGGGHELRPAGLCGQLRAVAPAALSAW